MSRSVSSRAERGTTSRRLANDTRGETLARTKRLSPVRESARVAAKEFSAKILHLSVGELAQATDTSKETAKCWKNGRAFPSGTALLALMSEFSCVQSWADFKTGAHREAPANLTDDFERLERVMESDTAQGRAMRARFLELSRGTNG